MAKRRRSQILFWAVSGVALASVAYADPPSADNYRLTFADEFNGTSLDTSKWSAASPSWTMPNSNSSASSADVSVANGILTLTANRPTSAASFDSGSISSYQKYTFTSGYAEARILLPTTPGSWPAFWGLYTGWPPETDIMEYPLTTNGGSSGLQNNQYNTNFHYTNSSGVAAAGAGVVSTAGNLNTTWHTFGADWKAGTSVTFYLDGKQVQSYSGPSVSQMAYMYMILDYAVGGWPGTPSISQWPVGHSDKTQVDWVRIWQTNPNNDTTSRWNAIGSGAFHTAGNWNGSIGVPAYGNETAYFGRVGTAPTAAITMTAWQMMGGITFDGSAGGTTAYTLGTSSNQIQLAGLNTTSTVTVQATASSTSSQTISAGEELWSNVNFQNNMTGGQTLNLNGNLSGAGNLSINGAGTVNITATGSFTGMTSIGSATGPAVCRVSADNALSTTMVTIGNSGGATTARLELMGNITLPNAIALNGRTDDSIGIENVSGNNTLTNTISAGTGGGVYQIQSDAGTLTLTGSAGAGVALQSNLAGSHVITLQGQGSGNISGKIQNGSGILSLAKADAGTWSLSGNNTFTGPITVTGGALVMNSSDLNLGTALTWFMPAAIILNGGALADNAAGTIVLNSNRGIQVGSAGGSINPFYGKTLSYGGVISDLPGNIGSLVKDSLGTLILSGNSNYSGSTSINCGLLQTNTTNALPVTTTLAFNDLVFQNPNATLNLAGFSQTFAGLTDDSTFTSKITNTVAGTGLLTVNGGGNFNGIISDGGPTALTSITKSASGSLLLNNMNTYSGPTSVTGGTLALGSAASISNSTSVNVSTNGTLNFQASAGSPILARTLKYLNVTSGGTVTLTPASSTSRQVLVLGGLNLSSIGKFDGNIDLANNDLIQQAGGTDGLSILTNAVSAGFDGGAWQTSGGLSSSSAALDFMHLTTLGVIENSVDQNDGAALYSSFDNQTVANIDVLVKYTYFGDTNLDGQVDGSDYSRIDSGYLTASTGWFNGDFNYDSVVNGSDYTLIDNAFNQQGATLAAIEQNVQAQVTTEIAVVPEPSAYILPVSIAVGLLRKRSIYKALSGTRQ